MKTLQLFSDEYLAECKKFSPAQIVQFLEDFRLMQQPTKEESTLISIKIPKSLLGAFRAKAKASGVKYQTKIKELMRLWLAAGLVSCGPVYQTDYIFTPPDSDSGYHCTVQCESSKQTCLQLEEIRYERCEERAERDYYWCERNKIFSFDKKGRRVCVSNCWCYRESCYRDEETCDENYRSCYQSCGGSVESRTVCISNCEQNQTSSSTKKH